MKKTKKGGVCHSVVLFALCLLCVIIGAYFFYQLSFFATQGGDTKGNGSVLRIEKISEEANRIHNVTDNFSVVYPSSWTPAQGTTKDVRLHLFSNGPDQPSFPSELVDGTLFKVFVLAQTTQSLDEYFAEHDIEKGEEVEINGNKGYKFESKLWGEGEDPFVDVEIEDSYVGELFITHNDKILKIDCVSVGESYKELHNACDAIMHSIAFD